MYSFLACSYGLKIAKKLIYFERWTVYMLRAFWFCKVFMERFNISLLVILNHR